MTFAAISSASSEDRPSSYQSPLPPGRSPHRPPARDSAGSETGLAIIPSRAAGNTAHLKKSGKLEIAEQIANHESPRTTKLYDRLQDAISVSEVERITILKNAGY
jgi:hypothetical protein